MGSTQRARYGLLETCKWRSKMHGQVSVRLSRIVSVTDPRSLNARKT